MSLVQEFEPNRQSVPDEGAKWHEYASIFPMMDNRAFRELVDDVRENGVREPIVFHEGQILDGRNRYCAAREVGIDYPYTHYEGDDPLGYVISLNLKRRHLTESQRAMVATRLAKLPHGGDRRSDQGANLRLEIVGEAPDTPLAPAVTQAEAARLLTVSERSIQTARKVEEQGSPELIASVESGKTSVSAAAAVASLPKEEQAEIVALGEKELLAKAKEIKDRQKAERAAKKAENERHREEARANLNPEIQKREHAKAEAVAASKAKPVDPDALQAELDEVREAYASLEADHERLKADSAKWADMKVQFEKGGFEKVIADKDEQIRVLRRQVERESQEKVKNLNSMEFWKKEAIKRGYGEEDYIEIPGRVANG